MGELVQEFGLFNLQFTLRVVTAPYSRLAQRRRNSVGLQNQ
jgi:hypothetical protein